MFPVFPTHFRRCLWLVAGLASLLGPLAGGAAESSREVIVRAILAESATEKRELITSLVGRGDDEIALLLTAWRTDALFIRTLPDGTSFPVLLTGEPDANGARAALRVDTGEPVLDYEGQPAWFARTQLTPVKHNNALRVAMKKVLDIVDIASPDEDTRYAAVTNLTLEPEKLPALRARLAREETPRLQRALRETIALIEIQDPARDVKLAALHELETLHPLRSEAALAAIFQAAQAGTDADLTAAARRAVRAVEGHKSAVNFFGTISRGVSTGSILLVVALGLAITFGLMGVINMAHGEMIAVGAYTTYLVQRIFGEGITLPFFGLNLGIPGLHLTGAAYQSYFFFALPLSFLAAAMVGIGLERSVIRFLYRRPLESLLATWGVSLLMQQVFKLMFGSNNVDVQKPVYLSGNWEVNDVTFAWAWLFVIGFVILTVIGLWLVLNRTPLGLLIRAVMQNRSMAACMGVRSTRVNLLTFALGSGLAGLAGAFVSQVNNVGPLLGQNYIIDTFMVVVVGGVGNLGGTVLSAYAIGGIDQVFQQYLPTIAPGLAGVPYIGNFLQNLGQDSAVFGKILVLCMIILFLQWRPAGIFVTRSRSLEG